VRAVGAAPLLQERLEGDLMAVELVVDEQGEVLAQAHQVSERIFPPGRGISSRARTVSIDPELAARVKDLLARVGWSGLAQLQFILPRDGEPSLIDFNGRIYGSIALAIAAGANLPAVWLGSATGRGGGAMVTAASGVRYQWLWGDLRRALAERRGGLIRDLVATLRYSRGAVQSLWHPDDPRPAIRYLRLVLARAARKRLRR
jgi:predicted ATP-grasp superfamily ATP-dependent carboligase